MAADGLYAVYCQEDPPRPQERFSFVPAARSSANGLKDHDLHRGRFELQVLLHDVIEKINQEPTVGLDAEQVTVLWLLVVLWTSHNLSRWERVCEALWAPASAFPSSGRPLILSAVRLRRCLCGTFRNCFCAVCLLPV